VSLSAGDEFVKRIRRAVETTRNGDVLGDFGGFAGLYRFPTDGSTGRQPVLVACTDGVGSKVLVAAKLGRLDTVGIDLVAMNVNDLVTCGARPLFFLDYLAVHRLAPAQTARLVSGVARGCREAGCALLGGETAEMPSVYRRGEFDLAGFAVGLVERASIIDGRRVRHGDALIGLAASGVHSNGYALVRKVFPPQRWAKRLPGLRGTLGQALLRPTRIYVKPILDLLRRSPAAVGAIAHITGSGLPGNLPRVLPPGCQAVIRRGSWTVPAIFQLIQAEGVGEDEMYSVFNMGIGMVLVVRRAKTAAVLQHFNRWRLAGFEIGTIVKGTGGVVLE
jgi:phosphoribosylformylglycinamidine cyclo-ligase